MERARVTPATGVSGHVSRRTGKGKETLKAELVEKPVRTDIKGVRSVEAGECESESRSNHFVAYICLRCLLSLLSLNTIY